MDLKSEKYLILSLLRNKVSDSARSSVYFADCWVTLEVLFSFTLERFLAAMVAVLEKTEHGWRSAG